MDDLDKLLSANASEPLVEHLRKLVRDDAGSVLSTRASLLHVAERIKAPHRTDAGRKKR